MDALHCMFKRFGDLQGGRFVVLQQMKRHARRRFGTHAGKLAQGLGQAFEGVGLHLCSAA